MDSIRNALKNMSLTNTKSLLKYITSPIGMYMLWVTLHYIAAHLYKNHCAPSGFWGFLLSPLMASTPYCTGLVWILQNSVIKFMAIWTIIGSWISYNLNHNEIQATQNNPNDPNKKEEVINKNEKENEKED